MTPRILAVALSALAATPCVAAMAEPPDLHAYNVVWTSPSRDSLDSMPLSGRKGAGANVWVQDGSIWIYLAHNGAYDEDGRLLKLGCLRITPADDALASSGSFRQELDLESGSIRISTVAPSGGRFDATLWFAGETLLVEASSDAARPLNLAFGTWRDRTRDGLRLDGWPRMQFTVRGDEVRSSTEGVAWAHRNADHPSVLAKELDQQPWSVGAVHNPAERLVFGGAIASAQLLTSLPPAPVTWHQWEGSAWPLRARASRTHRIAIALRAERDGDPRAWMGDAARALRPTILTAARRDERRRWDEFWSRSHIVINPAADARDEGWQVARNYTLFRYMLACNRDGALPLLFNGGIFTADAPANGRLQGNNNDELKLEFGTPSSPDFRRWLFTHFMAQNQRWLGWPTLAAGDTDLLAPSVAFYRDRAVTAAARARNLGADGVVYPEPLLVWGLSWNPLPNGLCRAEHLTYNFAMMLEHAWMALAAHSVLRTDIRDDLPWIEGVVRFFDTYYRAQTKARTGQELGAGGKLVLYPANSIEYTVGATNPVEAVAGLHRITGALLALGSDVLPAAPREYLEGVRARLPDLPTGTLGDHTVLAVADSFEKAYNRWELPELYAAWPYRLVGVTKPETLPVARATWKLLPGERTKFLHRDFSWMPVVVNMAALGLPGEAKTRVTDKLSDKKAQLRFPAFFGPGHDWLPDHNWGGSGMVGLQEMVLAADPYGDGRLHLLPAWPREWDLRFKLHAAQATTVEGELRGGRLVSLNVTPASRLADVVLPPGLTLPAATR